MQIIEAIGKKIWEERKKGILKKNYDKPRRRRKPNSWMKEEEKNTEQA